MVVVGDKTFLTSEMYKKFTKEVKSNKILKKKRIQKIFLGMT